MHQDPEDSNAANRSDDGLGERSPLSTRSPPDNVISRPQSRNNSAAVGDMPTSPDAWKGVPVTERNVQEIVEGSENVDLDTDQGGQTAEGEQEEKQDLTKQSEQETLVTNNISEIPHQEDGIRVSRNESRGSCDEKESVESSVFDDDDEDYDKYTEDGHETDKSTDEPNESKSDNENGIEQSENSDGVFDHDKIQRYVPPVHIKRIVSETNELMNQQFTARRSNLSIPIPEEDAMTTIQRRLDEISDMVTPRQEKGATLIEQLEEPLRNYVMELSTQSPTTFNKTRRKGWKTRQRFKYAIRMSLFAVRFMDAAKRYIQTKRKPGRNDAPIKSDEIEDEAGMGINAALNKNSTSKSSINVDLQIYLTTRPEFREPEVLKRIIWVLRTTKAFTMFSTEMEEEMARRVGYERYDSGRVIAYQGKTADRFYYILSGRVNMLRQYKLQTGEVTKSMGYLTKGKITDTEEIEKQWRRESNLVCKGPVEVLTIDKKDYFFLQNTDAGPPIEFLRTIDLFREFPCEEFLNHPEAIEFKYYGPNKQVVKDTNTRNWIFIVKSGCCKCVRRQDVVDVSQDKRLSSRQRLEKLGCAKGYSHADAMLETKMKRVIERGRKNFTLPEIERVPDHLCISNPHSQSLGMHDGGMIRTSRRTSVTSQSQDAMSTIMSSAISETSSVHENGSKDSELGEEEGGDQVDEMKGPNTKKYHRTSVSIELPPLAVAGSKERHMLVAASRQRRGMFMTQRARTEPHIMRRRRPLLDDDDEETPLRRAYLQLDLLKSGDMIGLNDLSGLTRARRSGVSVWSDGAEIIKVNKRFFRQHAGTVTMLKLETMNKEYVTEEDAMQNLEEQETWDQYKTILMKKLSQYSRLGKNHKAAVSI